MTKFAQSSFSVAVGSKSYRDNYDRIFRKEPEPHVLTSLSQEEYDKLEPPTEAELQAALDEGRPRSRE